MATEYFNDAWRIPNNKNQSLVSNYSMDFDGSENVSISPEVDLGINSSVSIWTNFSSTLNFVILGNNLSSNYLLYADATDIYVRIDTVEKTFAHSMVLNQWYNIILVRTGDSIEVFQNGNSLGTQTGYGTTLTTKINTIGSTPGGTFPVIGKIDQVSIFDYAFSATQVSTLYGGGTAVTNPMSLSPAPVAYYQLGDQSVSTGPTADYLVPNNSLQDYVFNFDGSDDYIDLSVSSSSSVPSEQSSWTYSAWLYLDSTHTVSFPNIFQRGQAYPGRGMLVRESGGDVNVYYGTASALFTVNKLLTNEWSHFALVYDISTNGLTCYINNSSQTITMVSGWSILSTTFNIGANVSYGRYWKGEMSNVQVFNTALAATGSNSIETIYNNGSPLTSMSGFTSLQGWWKLNAQDTFDGTDWTIKDYAGSNDGTSFNMDSSNLVQSDLQHTSGYSPYALNFDGVNDYLDTPQIDLGSTNTISFWINNSATNSGTIFGDPNAFNTTYSVAWGTSTNVIVFRLGNGDGGYWELTVSSGLLSDGNWHHHCLSRNGVTINYYIDGTLQTNVTNNTLNASAGTNTTIENIMARSNGTSFASGKLSNVALWNTELTSTQVTEIYNQGVPSNLNTFSGTAPVNWWQLGSNSSFDSNTWTCLDEIGSNNLVSSANMTNDAITDGVGYSASGLGTSSIEIVGDAPYSSGNGLSENMDVLDRTTDVPPTV